MAKPRQRRKSRSSSHRPVSHPRNSQKKLKKVPTLRAQKILQDAWDKRKTVRQNYAALGLLHTLNSSTSGGVEPLENALMQDQPIDATSIPPVIDPIPAGYGRIIRDEDGNPISVELPDSHSDETRNSGDRFFTPMQEPEIDEALIDRWALELNTSVPSSGKEVVKALEGISTTIRHHSKANTLSLPISGAGARLASKGEAVYLSLLVGKYGLDVQKMAKDRKLNPEQRTAGELKRALRKSGLFDLASAQTQDS